MTAKTKKMVTLAAALAAGVYLTIFMPELQIKAAALIGKTPSGGAE